MSPRVTGDGWSDFPEMSVRTCQADQCRRKVWVIESEDAFLLLQRIGVSVDRRKHLATSMFEGCQVVSGDRDLIIVHSIGVSEDIERLS
jgi:hypothetical protein